jgi:hypothetical protein
MAAESNLPTTFERRGTTVPLAHPDFLHTRVREYEFGKDRVLEAVMPNYSGVRRGELTVIQWSDLKDRAAFGERDLHIMQDIMRLRGKQPIDPIYIRLLIQRADAIHNPDEDGRRLAREQAERDRIDRESVRMSSLAQLTRECGISRGDAFMAKANTTTLLDLINDAQESEGFDVRMLIERVMQFAAERSGASVEDVRDWMDPLVGLIAPFGSVPAAGEERLDGFLFTQHRALLGFRKSLHEHGATAGGEAARTIELILEVCDQTITYVNSRLVRLDSLLGRFADMFEEIDGSITRLKKLLRDVSFALEGWKELIDIWEEAIGGIGMIGGEQAMLRAVDHILLYLPVIPEQEIRGANPGDMMERERNRLTLVRSMHSWGTNEMDEDLQNRVEAGRARAEQESKWDRD